TAGQVAAQATQGDAPQPTRRQEPLAHRALIEESPSSVAPQCHALPRPERHGIGDVAFQGNEPTFAREAVLLLGLDVPLPSQTGNGCTRVKLVEVFVA